LNPEPRTFQPGTGIDVWEIAAAFKETDENYIELQKNVPLVERNSTAVCAILLRTLSGGDRRAGDAQQGSDV
jgi:hypothetical protein